MTKTKAGAAADGKEVRTIWSAQELRAPLYQG